MGEMMLGPAGPDSNSGEGPKEAKANMKPIEGGAGFDTLPNIAGQ